MECVVPKQNAWVRFSESTRAVSRVCGSAAKRIPLCHYERTRAKRELWNNSGTAFHPLLPHRSSLGCFPPSRCVSVEEEDKQSVADLAELCDIHSAHSGRNFMSYRSSAMTLLKWKCAVFPFTCAIVITNVSLSTSPPGSKSEMAATSYTFPICNHWGRLIQKSQKRRKWEMFTKLHFTGRPCTSFVLYFNQQY